MRHMNGWEIKRWWSVLLIAALVLTQLPAAALAEVWTGGLADVGLSAGTGLPSGEGICPHHTEHTEDCGYQEAHACSHRHVQECYEKLDEDGDPEQDGAALSDTARTKPAPDATASDATASDAWPENCVHVHDSGCGYEMDHACGYHCKICAGEELSLEDQARLMEEQMRAEAEAGAARTGTDDVRRDAKTGMGTFRRIDRQSYSKSLEITPFVIGSEAVLRELAQKVNGGETWANGEISYAECSYVLREDVVLTSEWTPIGTEEHPFSGTFDGNGSVIRGVTIDDPDIQDCGLFGYIKGGTVEDLGVADVDIRFSNTAGAVASSLYGGAIRRCYSTGSLSTDKYDDSVAGGLVGRADLENPIKDCYSTVDIKSSIAGGIVGKLKNSILKNCYSTGHITVLDYLTDTGYSGCGGGLIGFLTIENNKRTGITNSIALNPAIAMEHFFGSRILGLSLSDNGSEDGLTLQENYAFSGMKAGKNVIGSGEHDNEDGADLTYDPGTQTFSTPLETIFDDASAWYIEPGKLPTLKGVGGQDGEIPEWLLNGTAADLYIGTEEELKEFRDRVNGAGRAEEDFAGKTVHLTADIRLTEEWTPAGTIDHPFRGSFNGGGHVVSGMTVDSYATWAGLFGCVKGGTIENLGVKDVDIRRGHSSGAVAGFLSRGSIRGCYSTGSVAGISSGGIVGDAEYAAIKDCHSSAEVGGISVGGIVGLCTETDMERCYSTGAVNNPDRNSVEGGGLIGNLGGRFTVIKNNAALNPSVDSQFVFAGRIYGDFSGSPDPNMEILGNYAFHGMEIGHPVLDGAENNKNGADLSYDPVTETFSTDWEIIFGGDTSAWDIGPGKLPTLKGVGGQDGTIPEWIWAREESPLLIGSEAELAAFGNMVNGTNGMSADDFAGKAVRLTADIRMTREWTPAGTHDGIPGSAANRPFKGVFDGDGHIIEGLSIDDSGLKNAGLFGYVDGGTVKNLGLKNVDIRAKDNVGAVAGFIENGTIQNCFSEGRMTADSNLGGIAGIVRGSEIRNCYSRGGVTAQSASAGGIAGMASMAGNLIEHCYSAGSVGIRNHAGSAGGLVGVMASPVGEPAASGLVRQNAALVHSLEGQAGLTGRVAGYIGTASESVAVWEQNQAFSGMKVNGTTAEGDDGTGRNGQDGGLKSLVMDQILFPASDWTLEEGCYPMLTVFADNGETPVPLEYWLAEQAAEPERFKIELEPSESYTFPSLQNGYRKPAGKAATVKNTGENATGELTATLTEQKKNDAAKPAGDGDYFTLTATAAGSGVTVQGATEAAMGSIAPGGSVSFVITPAEGLKAGTYTSKLRIAGKYGLSATCEVRFTVYWGDGSDDAVSKKPPYATLNGNVPSSVGTGTWERQPDGGWKFRKEPDTAGGISDAAGGPGVSGASGAGKYAKKEWLMIDGFWYLFGDDGRMVTGWAAVNGVWYYLSTAEYASANPKGAAAPGNAGNPGGARLKEGAMIKGWLRDPGTGLWFWFGENGAMASGWTEIGGKQYYFNPEPDGTRGKLMEDGPQ